MVIKELKVLYADEGKVLTNGEIYGRIVYLADGENESTYYEITDTEYEAMQPKAEEDVLC